MRLLNPSDAQPYASLHQDGDTSLPPLGPHPTPGPPGDDHLILPRFRELRRSWWKLVPRVGVSGGDVVRGALLAGSVAAHSGVYVFEQLCKRGHGGRYPAHFSPPSVVLVAELAKLAISASIFAHRQRRKIAAGEAERLLSWRESLWWAVPAVLYAVSNNLTFVTSRLLPSAAENQVLTSFEVPATAVLSVAILHKRLSAVQWSAVLLVMCGVVQAVLALHSPANQSWPLLACALALLHASCSALAGVLIQLRYQHHSGADLSFWQQTTHLCLYSVVVNVAAVVIRAGARGELRAVFSLAGWSGYAAATAASFTALGLVTGAIVKSMSAVVKVFTSSASQFVTALVGAALFGTVLNLQFIAALVIISTAFYLYKAAAPPTAAAPGAPEHLLASAERTDHGARANTLHHPLIST